MRGKFEVDSIEKRRGADGLIVVLAPIDEEDGPWRLSTKRLPSGRVELHVDNPAILPKFDVGRRFYVTLSETE